ncbi:MAG: hypothetical protein ACERLG_12100 [Sedimentibacter sp.]
MSEVSFILIDTGSESNCMMMGDVGRMKNGHQMSNVYHIENVLLRKLHTIHFSYKISTKVNVIGRKVWNRFCILDKMVEDDNKDYYVVFVNNSIHKISVEHLNALSRKKNVHFFILLLDVYSDFPVSIKKMIDKSDFEEIYSFQQSDCDKYGFNYVNTIYSRAQFSDSLLVKLESDLYFVGADKGRIDDVYGIYRKATDEGLKCNFTVVVDSVNLMKYRNRYVGMNIVDKRISYSTILEGIIKTRCILELCQKGQDGLTMRFYEALFYNKMLITNNRTAANNPMFNDKYMYIYHELYSADMSFLHKIDKVDYHYKDEMSPVHFMESLIMGDKDDKYNR